MTTTDQRRAWVLTKVLCDELTVHEAAAILGLSERSVWRLRPRFAAEGPRGPRPRQPRSAIRAADRGGGPGPRHRPGPPLKLQAASRAGATGGSS